MPFGLQPLHLLVIALVALIIFGPARLPEIGRGLGKALNEFRKGTREMTEGFREEVTRPIDNSSPAAPSAPAAGTEPAGGNFCPQCGSSNPSGAAFCNKCGAKLPGQA